uniref:CSON006806 protein n=1 Tax=Culicoides sonorensis TaxID=179676 RepID=A0A336N5D9_CULSO
MDDETCNDALDRNDTHTHEYYREKILDKLEDLGNGSRWLWMTFMLCITPSILNGFHTSSYVFLGQMPDDYWCVIPELQNMNWTVTEMRSISRMNSISKCDIFNWNYKLFGNMSYNEASEYVVAMHKPEVIRCGKNHDSYFAYDQKPGTSIVSEWDLVCDKLIYRTNVQMALSVGKFIGSSVLGIVADRWGRKFAFNISAIIYMIAGPLSFLTPWYWIFFFSRFLLGAAGSGVYNSAYTILTEAVAKKHRSWTSVVYSISYPVGTLILALLAYFQREWRNLQMCLTLPAFLLLINIIYLDESPRWLVNKNHLEKAFKIVFKRSNEQLKSIRDQEISFNSKEQFTSQSKSMKDRLKVAFHEITILYGTPNMRNKLLVCQFAWFVSSFSYYVIALNADNLSANRYIYIAMVGLFEIPSCIVPIAIMRFFGRRYTSLILFYSAGMSLLALFLIPTDEKSVITFTAMFGRFCIGAVFIVVILHTAELFPTEVRNSSIGTSSTMAHVGSISAPYVVDFLGTLAWFIPTTICAVAAISAGTLVMLLPETKNKELHDQVDENDEKNCDAAQS